MQSIFPRFAWLLTRDGSDPAELLQIARAQLARYTTVKQQAGLVTAILPQADGFIATLADETTVATLKVLLAMGLRDSCRH